MSYDNQMLLQVISQYSPPFLQPPKKAFLSSSTWLQIRGRSVRKIAYRFVLKIAMMFSIPTSRRNRMMNTFIIVKITSTYRRQFRGQIYACLLQKGLPSLLSLVKNRIYLGTHLKRELQLICFESYLGISSSRTGRADREM